MNSLESQIYTDAAAAAAEISAADIPPLRLRASSVRSPRVRSTRAARAAFVGPAGRAGARRWLVPLAAAASVVALVAVMVILGGGRNPGHHTARPAAPRPVSNERGLITEALDLYFPATGAQYTAGLGFEWAEQRIERQLLEPCMARAGFPQPAFRWPRRQYLLSFPDNSQFPDLAQRAQTALMTPNGIVGKLGKKSGRGYLAALRRCTASYAKPITALTRATNSPASSWLSIVNDIQSSAAVQRMQPAFASCLEAHGIPAAYANYRESASNNLFAGFFDWMDHLGMTSSSAHQQTREEHRWTPVFVTCARPTVSAMERLQLAARATFFKRHAQQISVIKTLAADVLRSVRR